MEFLKSFFVFGARCIDQVLEAHTNTDAINGWMR